MGDRERHPRGLYVLFFTEMWERFGFYTLLSIFTLYLDEHFHFASKGSIYGAFLACVYLTPVLGGFVADRWLGFRRTILAGAVLLGAGYALLAVPVADEPAREAAVVVAEAEHAAARKAWEARAEAFRAALDPEAAGQEFAEPAPEYAGPERVAGRPLFFLALLVLVLGNGLFKPNISVLVGNLYAPESPLRDAGFNIFYMGINTGAFFAPFAAAGLRATLGWPAAFAMAAVGMGVAMVLLVAFRRLYAAAEVGRPVGAAAEPATPLTRAEEGERVKALLTIFGIVVLFWMSFAQGGFTLTLWARDNTGPLLGWVAPAELYSSLNPFFVVTLTPLVVAVWAALRRRGREPSTPGKIGWGMLLTAAAFGVMALAAVLGGDYLRVSPGWLGGTYVLITLAELCLSPMGLSFCSRVAPARMRGLMMGGWFAATAAGMYLAGLLEGLWQRWPHSAFFAFFVATSLAAALLLRWRLRALRAATSGA